MGSDLVSWLIENPVVIIIAGLAFAIYLTRNKGWQLTLLSMLAIQGLMYIYTDAYVRYGVWDRFGEDPTNVIIVSIILLPLIAAAFAMHTVNNIKKYQRSNAINQNPY